MIPNSRRRLNRRSSGKRFVEAPESAWTPNRRGRRNKAFWLAYLAMRPRRAADDRLAARSGHDPFIHGGCSCLKPNKSTFSFSAAEAEAS